MSIDPERYAAEQWLRRRGLPAVVRGRPTRLLVRIAPAVVFLIVWELVADVVFVIDGASEDEWDRLMENPLYVLVYNLLLLGLVVFPPVGAWLAMRWVRAQTVDSTPRGTPVAVALLVIYTVALPVFEELIEADYLLRALVLNASLALLAVVVVYVGGGAVLGWALRTAVRQLRMLGTLTSRALPLLLLFTTFGFLTAEVWQMVNALSIGQVWLVVAFFLVLAMLFMVAVLSDELHELTGSGPDGIALRPVERVNMVLVLLLAQMLQALVFGALMLVIFAIFGTLAVRPQVMKAWSTRDLTNSSLFDIRLPLSNELLHVSIFLGAFSALYFVASTATDAKIRQTFFDPLIAHMAQNLSARHDYLTRWGNV